VGRIYMETKQRPRYLVRKRHQHADTTCSDQATRTLSDGVVLS
jgi:hypothetical protein